MKANPLVIPQGCGVKQDKSGDCYECCFCVITGEGEHEELDCGHPTPSKTGCADHDIVFVEL